MPFDPIYFIFTLPGILLAAYASFMTKSTFAHFSKVASSSGMTGAEAAAKMLMIKGINNVSIEYAQGFLGDHYDPQSKTLRLSKEVYDSTSLSAIGVACHEAGHAIQHAENYSFLTFRTAMVPAVNVSSSMAMPFILIGFFLGFNKPLILIGCVLFAFAVLFSIITLPVEWDASSRAKVAMVTSGIVSERESASAGKVLNAAFLTYLAAAVSSLATLLYFLVRSGILGGNDD